jgi:outer membrane protein TolC
VCLFIALEGADAALSFLSSCSSEALHSSCGQVSEDQKTMTVMHSTQRLMLTVTRAIFLLACAAPTNVLPQQQPAQTQHALTHTGGVSLANLIETALAANPEITAMKREFDAARARIPQAKALPDPMVMLSNSTVTNPVPFAGVRNDFSEIALGFSQDLPWFGVRRLRGQVADAAAEAKFQEYVAAVLRLTSEVKTAYYDLYYTDRALAVLARDKDILERVAQVAEARYSVGKAQQVDVINVRVEITELLDKQGVLESKRAITAAQLNHLLYRDPETPIEKLADVKLSPEPPRLEELTRLAAENAPELKQLRRLIDGNNKALRLAEREAKYPEVGVNFTYHNRPFFADYYTYGVTLRLPLYTATKQRYAIKEQAANLAATQARLDTNFSLIRYKLRDARVRTSTAARLIKLHEQGLIPQATLALESALSAYQTGQLEMLTLLTTLKRALDYETRYYELLSDYQKALAELERFTGVELTK